MKIETARKMVNLLLDSDATPTDPAELEMLADMARKSQRENLGALLESLGREGLRCWVEALLQTSTESPATARIAADNLLDNMCPVLVAAGMMLRERVH